jgi:hypothetical protein
MWMPLPTMLELGPAALYPVWNDVVSSGLTFSVISALAAAASSVLLLFTATRLGLPRWLGCVYALVIALNPMLFLYGANGMSEGICAPFLIGSVCFLTLFWYSGQRLYVGVSGVLLAFGFASIYEAVPFGIAVFLALIGGVLWTSEARGAMRQGRWRALEGLGLAFVLPSAFAGVLWITSCAVIVGDPLYFMHGPYSTFSQNEALAAASTTERTYAVAGDITATLHYTAERTWPFLIPTLFLLLVRALDRRLFRINSLSLVVVSLSVPFGLIAPFLYRSHSAGYLRYFMFPLFAAAGWGLFEIAISGDRRRAIRLILVGWVVAGVAALWAMSEPSLAPETEHVVVRSVLSGDSAEELGFENSILRAKPIAEALEESVLRDGGRVVVEQLRGFAIATNLDRDYLNDQLILTPDRRFDRIVSNPQRFDVQYFLVPNPAVFPADAIVRARPKLWSGHDTNFVLVTDFAGIPTPEQWRLYEVVRSRK